jgi:hypothetical protein
MRIALHIAGMLVLGIAALAGFMALQQWRVHAQASPRDSLSSAGGTRAQAPLDALAAGIESSLRAADGALGQRGTRAATALDAAKRAAEVGGLGFRHVHAWVAIAREAMQNGDATRARNAVREALGALRKVNAQGHGPMAHLDRYRGATLIDTRGERIGEIGAVAARSEQRSVQLVLGGAHDAAGFVDTGGRALWVPADALIFGKPKLIGSTLVAWTGNSGTEP